MSFWDKFFDFLEKVLPGMLGAFGFGYKLGKNKEEKLESDLEREKVKTEEMENQANTQKKYSGMSPDAIVDDIAKQGADLRRSDK